MDPVGIGLAFIAIVLFALTLGLSTRPDQFKQATKKRLSALVNNSDNDHKTIVVKLPQGERYPGDYTINLKVSLSKAKTEVEEEKEIKNDEPGKKFYRRLDEYF